MNIMALDPGLRGGIAILNEEGKPVFTSEMPIINIGDKGQKIMDVKSIQIIIQDHLPEYCFLEKVHSMPGQGVVSTFSFGMGYGMVMSAIILNAKHLELIYPQHWQRHVLDPIPKWETMTPKVRAKNKFTQLWPDLAAMDMKHDGIIDALLLAEYGRRTRVLGEEDHGVEAKQRRKRIRRTGTAAAGRRDNTILD